MAGVILLLSVVLSLVTFVVCQDIREPPTIVEPLTKVSHFYEANDRVTITCRATGTPQPAYEWRYNDAAISSQFMSIDAVTGVLTIPSLTEREEGLFTCRATNRFPNGQSATAISAVVEIRVARVGDFVLSPTKTIPAVEGKYLKLACDDRIPIYYGPISFSWYITTLDNKLTEIIQDERIFIDQVGSLHFAYVLKRDESVLGTRYQCAIKNSGQGIIKLGSDNIITVTAQGLQDQKPVLQYRSMGKSIVVFRNEDALLECLFSGYTSSAAIKVPLVTWVDDAGVQISGGDRHVIGRFGHTLTIKNVQESDEKTYTCRASNALGQEEGQMSLNVTSTPIWIKPLEKVTVPEGESAKFTCIARSAAGETPPDPPEWYLNGIHMASNYDPTKYIFSEEKRVLTVLHTNKDTDIACFQCYVGNSNGYEFDDGCLNVILQINIVVQPPKLNQEIEKGDIVNLTVVATGDPSTPLTYRWIFRNKTFDDLYPPPHVQVNPVTKLAFINTTELSEAQLQDITGIYQREVFHKYQTKRVNIEIRLKGPPPIGDFLVSPPKIIPAQEGKYLKLACDEQMPIFYGPPRWYITTYNKLTEVNQDERIYIDYFGSLHFAYVLKSDESVSDTRYKCAITYWGQWIIKLGSDNFITVTEQGLQDQKPVLQYRSMVVLQNGDALLECLFSGYTSSAANKVPSVRWFDDAGVPISGNGRYVIGPFGRTLIIKNVQESDKMTYTCRASNALGQKEGQISLNFTSSSGSTFLVSFGSVFWLFFAVILIYHDLP